MTVKLVSSDLNGTLVHQHTMSGMIKLYIGEEQFRTADELFRGQTNGTVSIPTAFGRAAALTEGLTLKQACNYVLNHMEYVNGFHAFVSILQNRKIPFVINSTGYSVTIYAIKETVGRQDIHGHIGNRLLFGMDGDHKQTLTEEELERKVCEYIHTPAAGHNDEFKRIKATGEVALGIPDESAKAKRIIEYAREHFPGIKPEEICHVGDTMGDSQGILQIAKLGGTGIAFNYNDALEQFLREQMAVQAIPGNIHFVDKKSHESSLVHLMRLL